MHDETFEKENEFKVMEPECETLDTLNHCVITSSELALLHMVNEVPLIHDDGKIHLQKTEKQRKELTFTDDIFPISAFSSSDPVLLHQALAKVMASYKEQKILSAHFEATSMALKNELSSICNHAHEYQIEVGLVIIAI